MTQTKSDKPQAKSISIPLSSKGQLVIPKQMRDQLGWRAGMQVRVSMHSDGLHLAPQHIEKKQTVEQLLANLQKIIPSSRWKPSTIDEMDAAVTQMFASVRLGQSA